MKRTKNVVRFLALLMAFAMLFAVLATATLPLAATFLGAASADVVPLAFIMTLAVFLLAGRCLQGRPFVASSARAGPAFASDALNGDQFMMREKRRQWAHKYPSGFRSCRLSAKHGASRPMILSYPCTSMPPGAEPSSGTPAESVLFTGTTVCNLVRSLCRKAQCNLYAFNANDESVMPCMAAA